MKKLFFVLLFTLVFQSSISLCKELDPVFKTIPTRNVLLYENPTTSSSIKRRTFVGEVLKIIETVKNDRGEVWSKVYLSPYEVAYIQETNLANSDSLEQQVRKPEAILRHEMPISFSFKGTSELFGPGLQFRYLPFTRLGFSVGAGSVFDHGQGKGFSLAYGAVFIFSMKNFSPFLETGTSTLTFNDSHSTLRISTFYVNAGVEWILPSGYFLGVGISYNRSYNVHVAYDYDYAKKNSGNLKVGDYGSFGSLDTAESLQRLNPLFTFGYSF